MRHQVRKLIILVTNVVVTIRWIETVLFIVVICRLLLSPANRWDIQSCSSLCTIVTIDNHAEIGCAAFILVSFCGQQII